MCLHHSSLTANRNSHRAAHAFARADNIHWRRSTGTLESHDVSDGCCMGLVRRPRRCQCSYKVYVLTWPDRILPFEEMYGHHWGTSYRRCSDRNPSTSPDHMAVDGRTFSATSQDVRSLGQSMLARLKRVLERSATAVTWAILKSGNRAQDLVGCTAASSLCFWSPLFRTDPLPKKPPSGLRRIIHCSSGNSSYPSCSVIRYGAVLRGAGPGDLLGCLVGIHPGEKEAKPTASKCQPYSEAGGRLRSSTASYT